MKTFAAFLAAAGLMLGAAAPASAVDVKMNGIFDFDAEYVQNMGTASNMYNFMDAADAAKQSTTPYHEKNFGVIQRLIVGAQFTVSENLSAYYDCIMALETWGGPATGQVYGVQMQGGALGTRSANIVTRQAYMTWVVPHTRIRVRMGQQFFLTPHSAGGSPFIQETATGVAVSAPLSDSISLNVNWIRALSEARRGSAASHWNDDTLDIFQALLPVKFEGAQVTPWLAVAIAGRGGLAYGHNPGGDGLWPTSSGMLPLQGGVNTALGYGLVSANNKEATDHANSRLKNSTAVWAGLTGNLTMLDPWRFGLDSVYSHNGQSGAYKRAGWYASAEASYKTKYGAPALLAWYSSGEDGNIYNGSERVSYLYGGFSNSGPTSFFMSPYGSLERTFEQGHVDGTWGVSAQWRAFSLLPDLFHRLNVTYIHGNNSKAALKYATRGWDRPQSFLTKADAVVEVDFISTYSIYKNLAAQLQIAYLIPHFDGALRADAARANGEKVPAGVSKFTYSNGLRTSLMLRYTF